MRTYTRARRNHDHPEESVIKVLLSISLDKVRLEMSYKSSVSVLLMPNMSFNQQDILKRYYVGRPKSQMISLGVQAHYFYRVAIQNLIT
jgi:hypothetical protein